MRAKVITCSDRVSRGERSDSSGPAVAALLARHGFGKVTILVVPDDRARIAEAIVHAIDVEDVRIVVTTGGTGLSPRDVTPEATRDVCGREVPGIGELMRSRSLSSTPFAILSRCGAAVRRRALVVNLPGSVGGAIENLESILPILPHALSQLRGVDDHERNEE